MTSIQRRATILALAFLALCGCSKPAESPIINEDTAVVDINELPNIDETRAQMIDLIERARIEVARMLPSTEPWEWRGDETNAPCKQESTDHRGAALYLRRLVSEAELNDDEWNAVLPAVRRIAAEHGLTDSSSPQVGGKVRDIRFSSDDGRELVFLSRATTLFSGTIACRRHGGGEE